MHPRLRGSKTGIDTPDCFTHEFSDSRIPERADAGVRARGTAAAWTWESILDARNGLDPTPMRGRSQRMQCKKPNPGTGRVKDINPGAGGSAISGLTPF
ncbi:MAG: hypothetical protein WBO23_08510 [Burkholderiales bacterium]